MEEHLKAHLTKQVDLQRPHGHFLKLSLRAYFCNGGLIDKRCRHRFKFRLNKAEVSWGTKSIRERLCNRVKKASSEFLNSMSED